MRIVSLVPSATEWLEALSASSDLVGVDHLSASRYDNTVVTVTGPESGDVPPAGAERYLQRALGPYHVDLEAVRELKPDLIVASVFLESDWRTLPEITADWHEYAGFESRIFSFRPQILKQVMDLAIKMGRAAGRLPAALSFCGDIEIRIKKMQMKHGFDPKRLRDAPRVAAFSGLDPLTLAGGWVPDIIEWAGGVAVGLRQGHDDKEVSLEELKVLHPDFFLQVPDGKINNDGIPAGLDELAKQMDTRWISADPSTSYYDLGPGIYGTIEALAPLLHA